MKLIIDMMKIKFDVLSRVPIPGNNGARARADLSIRLEREIVESKERLSSLLIAKNYQDITVANNTEYTSISNVIRAAYIGQSENPDATLLHWACKTKQSWVVQQLLMDPHCSPETRCSNGLTAFEWAIAANSEDCINILTNHKKFIAERDKFIQTCIVLARDKANPNSESIFAKLPTELLLHLLSFWNFGALAKTKEQGIQCASFILNNIGKLNQLLKRGQGLPIVENKKLVSSFRFFGAAPAEHNLESSTTEIMNEDEDEELQEAIRLSLSLINS